MMANAVEPRKDDSDFRWLAGGCIRLFIDALLGSAWLYGALNAVWWYERSCHNDSSGPGDGFLALVVLAAGWLGFTAYVSLSRRLIFRAVSRASWIVTVVLVLALLVGAALLTWGFWAWAIPTSYEPTSYGALCASQPPPGWPLWIPIPRG
ncbi:hypothetical protein Atai01_47030 [Amycolatopsis taiwanensis]|uniref:Uncharacterized protein n=1 Tax=Amycolatopsis taiwanensis TaxID=342230 RepID=A0A9W6R2S4_9PSEU|nr:hypothetical protein Atai01_47030 [Amycolatopsis taiwanensis]